MLLLVTFETNDNYSIPFEISNNSSNIRYDSIQNEKKNTIRTALPLTELCTHFNGNTRHCAVAVSDNYLLIFLADGQPNHARTEGEPPLHVTRLKTRVL